MTTERFPYLTFENTDSKEEVYAYWYLKQLYDNGYITLLEYHPSTLELFPSKKITFNMMGKTKTTKKTISLLLDKEYTMDFKVIWSSKARGTFFIPIDDVYLNSAVFNASIKLIPFYAHKIDGEFVSFIDVKGTFSSHGQKSDMIFSLIQKIFYDTKKHYINKFIPAKLFKETFTPDKYIYTDMMNALRKIKFEIVSFHSYINNHPTIIHYDDPNYEDSSGEGKQAGGTVYDHPKLPSSYPGRRTGKKTDQGPGIFEGLI